MDVCKKCVQHPPETLPPEPEQAKEIMAEAMMMAGMMGGMIGAAYAVEQAKEQEEKLAKEIEAMPDPAEGKPPPTHDLVGHCLNLSVMAMLLLDCSCV
jgi:hypothetical protein